MCCTAAISMASDTSTIICTCRLPSYNVYGSFICKCYCSGWISTLSRVSASTGCSPCFQLIFTGREGNTFHGSGIVIGIGLSCSYAACRSAAATSIAILQLILNFTPYRRSKHFSKVCSVSVACFIYCNLKTFRWCVHACFCMYMSVVFWCLFLVAIIKLACPVNRSGCSDFYKTVSTAYPGLHFCVCKTGCCISRTAGTAAIICISDISAVPATSGTARISSKCYRFPNTLFVSAALGSSHSAATHILVGWVIVTGCSFRVYPHPWRTPCMETEFPDSIWILSGICRSSVGICCRCKSTWYGKWISVFITVCCFNRIISCLVSSIIGIYNRISICKIITFYCYRNLLSRKIGFIWAKYTLFTSIRYCTVTRKCCSGTQW